MAGGSTLGHSAAQGALEARAPSDAAPGPRDQESRGAPVGRHEAKPPRPHRPRCAPVITCSAQRSAVTSTGCAP